MDGRSVSGLGLLGLRAVEEESLGSGFFNEVRAVSGGMVVKVAKPYGPLRQPLSWLLRNRLEHSQVEPYLPVPPTYHVRMRTLGGPPASVILQARLHGRLLSEVSDAELRRDPLRGELEAIVAALRRCYREMGWLPDVIGGPPRWGMHDVRRSNNLLVDLEGRVWLIDPGALFFWFSSRNIVGRVYTRVLLGSAERMVRAAARGR